MIVKTLATLLSMATLLPTIQAGGGLPPNWWKNTLGTPVTSNQQYKDLVSGSDPELKDKHVFIDFYMQGCYWCYVFQEEWNQITKDMTELYGDKVEFLKVDGNNVFEVSRKYGVQSFPTFIYVKPNTKGMQAVMFQGERTYDGMISWMKKLMKDVPKLIEDENVEEEEAPVIDQSYDQGNAQQVPPAAAYSGSGDAMIGQVMQRVDSLGHGLDLIISNQAKISTQISNKKDNQAAEAVDKRMDELMDQLAAIKKQVEA
jgi:thioredoxin-like negative regulator of GroEL